MLIYLVLRSYDYEDSDVLSAHSQQERAVAFIEATIKADPCGADYKKRNNMLVWVGNNDRYVIQELEVDKE